MTHEREIDIITDVIGEYIQLLAEKAKRGEPITRDDIHSTVSSFYGRMEEAQAEEFEEAEANGAVITIPVTNAFSNW